MVIQAIPRSYRWRQLHRHCTRWYQVVDWRTRQHRKVVGPPRGAPVATARLCITDLLARLLSNWRMAGRRVRSRYSAIYSSKLNDVATRIISEIKLLQTIVEIVGVVNQPNNLLTRCATKFAGAQDDLQPM